MVDQLPKSPYWKSHKGLVRIDQLDDNHLQNIAKLILRSGILGTKQSWFDVWHDLHNELTKRKFDELAEGLYLMFSFFKSWEKLEEARTIALYELEEYSFDGYFLQD